MDPVNDETNNDEANNETNDETNNEVDEVEAITTALESVERKLREKVQELNETLSTIKCETQTFIDRQQRLSKIRASTRRQITAIIKKIHHDIFPDEKKYKAKHGYVVADWIFENCLDMRLNDDGTHNRKYWNINDLNGRRVNERSFTEEYSKIGFEILEIIRNAQKTMNQKVKTSAPPVIMEEGEQGIEQVPVASEKGIEQVTSTIEQVTSTIQLTGKHQEYEVLNLESMVPFSEKWGLESLIEAALDFDSLNKQHDPEDDEVERFFDLNNVSVCFIRINS